MKRDATRTNKKDTRRKWPRGRHERRTVIGVININIYIYMCVYILVYLYIFFMITFLYLFYRLHTLPRHLWSVAQSEFSRRTHTHLYYAFTFALVIYSLKSVLTRPTKYNHHSLIRII